MRWIILAAFGIALGYIVFLQRKLAAAERRGDMYRDIAHRPVSYTHLTLPTTPYV
jgi:hypothetical protein